MKTYQWNRCGNQVINSMHKTFNRQTNLITTGNVIANTQISGFVRSYNTDTNPQGVTVEKGMMQEWDLSQGFCRGFPTEVKCLIRLHSITCDVIAYKFRYTNKCREVVVGYLITTTDHKELQRIYSTERIKQRSALEEAIKYVTH